MARGNKDMVSQTQSERAIDPPIFIPYQGLSYNWCSRYVTTTMLVDESKRSILLASLVYR